MRYLAFEIFLNLVLYFRQIDLSDVVVEYFVNEVYIFFLFYA